MKYVDKHWKTFLNSFRLDALAFKLLVTDILFILTVILTYGILYAFWMKNVLSVSAILGVENGDVPAVSNIDILGMWNIFIAKTLFILILCVLLYILLISLYSAFSHTFINRKDFTLRLFLNFLCIYAILTLLYFIMIAMIYSLSSDTMFIAWSVIILTMIYLYSLLIFYLVTNDGKIMKIVRHGLKDMAKLHYTLPPLVLGLLLLTLISIVIGLLLGNLLLLSATLALLTFLYLATWLKKYLHHIIREV
jgi:hypothetical protein